METHTASATFTQLYSPHTYIKLNINGHSGGFLIQCNIAPLSFTDPSSGCPSLLFPLLLSFSLCTDDYCSRESAVKALVWQEWD